jgi:hypothetical protein
LRPEYIDAVMAQEISFICVRGFLSVAWCSEITRRFLDFIERHPERRIRLSPDAKTNVTIDAVALPMNVFVQSRPPRLDEYFAHARTEQADVRRIFEGGDDPVRKVREYLSASSWNVVPATEAGQAYLTDIVWGTLGGTQAPPHVDSYHLETACSLSRFKRRFSFNTFIQRPETGGNFKVFRWRKEDGPFPGPSLVDSAEYEVSPGDLIMFDAGNFHEVQMMAGQRHRLFSHMAVGMDPDLRECSIFI